MSKSKHRTATKVSALLFCLLAFCCSPVSAQTGESIAELKEKVLALVEQTKYTEGLPLLERIILAEPQNAEMHFYLGFALLAQATNTKDQASRKALRVRALAAYVKSKELGNQEPLLDALIYSIPPDGTGGQDFSTNIAANSLMIEAEAFFSRGKLDEALKDYQKALELDPKLYYAALFAGDVFMQRGDYAQGEIWYNRAIAIDPNRETAYRYSATPLMKQGKIEAARDRYIEAFITEPYNNFSRVGLVQWAQVTKTNLAHPDINIPTDVTFDDKGNANINLDAGALLGGKDDGSFAWISYGLTRSTWRKELFAKRFPREAYRRSLPEELDALRSVIKLATADKKVRLNPSLTKLKKLDDEGLLEAFILLAIADAGISRDHPAYLKTSRDKLRQYMIEYVLAEDGK